ncbi:Innexin [Dirofilaria immitis]|nr:Innexin [Dirofilaria immitis]
MYSRSEFESSSTSRGSQLHHQKGRERSSATGYHPAAVLEIGAMLLQNMFSALSFLHYRKDDDFVDRLSYFYTPSFLIMMAILVSFKQFGGRPLECWVPAQFTSSWEAYTEMYCWAQNTYWVPIEQRLKLNFDLYHSGYPNGYSRAGISANILLSMGAIFLLIQAFLYYIPCLIWRLMSDKSVGYRKENIESDYRTRTIESLARHIESALSVPEIIRYRYQHAATSRTQYTLHRVLKCLNMRYYECYVTGLYLTDEYSIYGIGVLRDLLFGRSWMESGNFSRVTLCDFEVRVLGNNQRHSVQCVLVINIFNEKIFILIWLWFSMLFVAATLDAIYWFSISLFHRDRFRFVLRHLELTTDPDRPELFRKEKRKQVEHFLKVYLKVDGVLVLRMIALHAGVMFCTEITDALWKRYLSQHPENLIDEDSSLINFARTQSIRRKRQSDDGNGDKQKRHQQLFAHQRFSKIFSRRTQTTLRLNRGQDSNRSPDRYQKPQIQIRLPKQTPVRIQMSPGSQISKITMRMKMKVYNAMKYQQHLMSYELIY